MPSRQRQHVAEGYPTFYFDVGFAASRAQGTGQEELFGCESAPWQTESAVASCFVTFYLMPPFLLTKVLSLLKGWFSSGSLSCESFLIIPSTCYFMLTFCRCTQGPQPSIRMIASEFVSSKSSLDVLLLSWYDKMTLKARFLLLIRVEDVGPSDGFSFLSHGMITAHVCKV